jgi:rhodanese-related sulfurtransferase
LHDVEANFEDLMRQEYVGSLHGSSLAELSKAAKDHGMYAQPMGNLTKQVLSQSPYLILLHVKKPPHSRRYNHYELFLGMQDGMAKLCSPPSPVRLVAFHDLLPLWSGKGLVVSKKPIDTWKLITPACSQFMQWATIALVIIGVAYWLRRRWLNVVSRLSWRGRIGLSVIQSGGLIGIALVASVIWHLAIPAGLLANTNAAASVELAHWGNLVPKVNIEEVRRLVGTDVVFVDARYPNDYESGHLEGAINIPVTSSDEERKKAVARIPKHSHIVVYCQSTNCKFAEKVSLKLKLDGYENIAIFRGGWHEWEQREADQN